MQALLQTVLVPHQCPCADTLELPRQCQVHTSPAYHPKDPPACRRFPYTLRPVCISCSWPADLDLNCVPRGGPVSMDHVQLVARRGLGADLTMIVPDHPLTLQVNLAYMVHFPL